MKRQIKFRAFQDNQMLESPINSNYGLQKFFGLLYEDAPIMQFAGHQDINGKDIYEGDILCVPHLENTRHQVRMVIEWENENSRFTKYYPRNAFQIIGNIYENPELLKTTENE